MPKSSGIKAPSGAHRTAGHEIRVGYQSDVASPRAKHPIPGSIAGNGEPPRSTPVVRESLVSELNKK